MDDVENAKLLAFYDQSGYKVKAHFISNCILGKSFKVLRIDKSKRFKAENASLKLEQDKVKPENIRFTINGTDIFDWFKLKQKEFINAIGINPKEKRGLKI